MSKFTFEFLFDEVQVKVGLGPDKGLLAYGRAILADNGDGDFFVQSITLDGGYRLSRPQTPHGHAKSFEGELFTRIAETIESERTAIGRSAAIEWADAITQANEPDPDYERDRRRDDAAYFAHNSKARLEYERGVR